MRLIRACVYKESVTEREMNALKSAALIPADIKFEPIEGEPLIFKFKDYYSPKIWKSADLPGTLLSHLHNVEDLELSLTAETDKLMKLQQREVTQVNTRVNVAVPGFGLMAIREVVVREDYCTDMLQQELNAGWQILAICPQPDQRRPDYILGKPKTEDV